MQTSVRVRAFRSRRAGEILLVAFTALLPCACRSHRAAPETTPAAPIAPVAPALSAAARDEIHRIALAEFERQQLVGLSLVLARHDGLIHVEHFGFEDRQLGIPASDATLYRWASISKPLTAVAAMQLAEAGRLDLDRDVRAYVPEFPARSGAITARQLLTHQGGIVHYTNGPVVAAPPRTDRAHPYEDAVDAVGTFALSPLVCEPGTKHSYSTHGYVLLGAVVQRAGAEPFEQQVIDRIALPLGMSTLRSDKSWIDVPHRAAGYRRVLGAIVPSMDVDVSWKVAGGGFISSAPDLGRFGAGLLAGVLVEPATQATMWTAQPTRDGTATGYGLGFRVGEHRGRRLISHGGSQEKTRTLLMLLPDQDVALALMCNSEWASLPDLGKALLDAACEAAP
jgi:CubicO group peptidase (beta-lactamase class C family)